MEIKPFGDIDPANLEEYYEGEIEFQGAPIEIDLNFESEEIEPQVFERVSEVIQGIDGKIAEAFTALSENYDLDEESSAVKFYLKHHQSELSEDELKEIFGATEISKELFFKKIAVNRIGLYPEDDEYYLLIDIKLPDKYTNYLMSVVFDSEGRLVDISIES